MITVETVTLPAASLGPANPLPDIKEGEVSISALWFELKAWSAILHPSQGRS